MYCLKCGKDTEENQVFCEHCLQIMDTYPVKPGTAVNLPRQATSAAAKKAIHRKRPLTPDEQIANLHKHLSRARLFAWILSLLLLASSGMLIYEILNPDGPIIGQNYTIDTTQNAD